MVRSFQVIILYTGEIELLGEVECYWQLKIIYHPNKYPHLMILNPLLLRFILAKFLSSVSYIYHPLLMIFIIPKSDVFCSLPRNVDVLILGDFNTFPDIDWGLLSGESQHSINFCGLISYLNLRQLIASSTHKAGNILNLVLTNNDQLVCDIVTHSTLPMGLKSDHYIITFTVSITQHIKARSPRGSFFNYSKAN